MTQPENKSRRRFLKEATGAAALIAGATAAAPTLPGATRSEQPVIHPAGRAPQISPNSRIRIATIGHGIIGTIDTATALRVPGVELVAVADVYDGRFVRARELYGNDIFTTRDYREILARPDIDAVIVATPDHWHAPMAIDAMNAGKDVYLEKPMVHKIEEGQRVIDAQRRTKRIVQVGSQLASSMVFQKAAELLAAGAIGELNLVEASWTRNSPLGAWQYFIPPDATPEHIDWDRFLGRAPKRPFDPVRLFRWRNYRDYGTAVAGDLFVHLFTGLHLVAKSTGPTRVMSLGGLRYWKDGREVPDVMLGIYEYPRTATHSAFNLQLSVNFIAAGGGSESGFRFTGSEGMMIIGNGITLTRLQPGPYVPDTYHIPSFPRALQETYHEQERAKDRGAKPMGGASEVRHVPPPGYDSRLDHFANFFDSMRSRQPTIEDAVFGFRAAGPALLTNQSYYDNRAYSWDPEKMRIVQNGDKS